MPDYNDDWMRPYEQARNAWVSEQPKPKLQRFLIQRERVIICSWSGDGPPREWKTWSSHDTALERDAEMNKLRAAHPAWLLRAVEVDMMGVIRNRTCWDGLPPHVRQSFMKALHGRKSP